jgi:hypothetical protein
MKPNYRLSMKHTDSTEKEFCGGGDNNNYYYYLNTS